MIAILTKYVGPTNTRGARVSVSTCNNHRMMVVWADDLGVEENHRRAAQALADKMGWNTKDGYAFVSCGDSELRAAASDAASDAAWDAPWAAARDAR